MLKAMLCAGAAFAYCWLFVDLAQAPVTAWLTARTPLLKGMVIQLLFLPALALFALACDALITRTGTAGTEDACRDRPWLAGWAFVAAPCWTALMMAVGTPVLKTFDPASVLGLTLVFYPFVAVVTMAVGVPLYVLLHYLDKVNLGTILLGGIVAGGAGGVLPRLPGAPVMADLLSTAAMGALSALLFWSIWRRRAAVDD